MGACTFQQQKRRHKALWIEKNTEEHPSQIRGTSGKLHWAGELNENRCHNSELLLSNGFKISQMKTEAMNILHM